VAAAAPVRVLISYAHDSDEHRERVRGLWLFLQDPSRPQATAS